MDLYWLFHKMEAPVNRQSINTVSVTIPAAMSFAALGLVLFALVSGQAKGQGDEGTIAHLFQLLIVAQAPLFLLFAATADWKHLAKVARRIILPAATLVLALASAYYLT